MDAVDCELKYSGRGIAAVLAAAAASFALVAALPWELPMRLALLAYVAATACGGCRSLTGARRLRLDRGRAIEVEDRHGQRCGGRVCDGCFVAPWLTVVRWRPAGARRDRTLLLLPGMAGSRELRKIRVLLRWG